MAHAILIRNGRVIDPTQQIDAVESILLVDGRVAAIGRSAGGSGDEVIDAQGQIVSPGLIDMHVHLREPGHEEKETIETGTAAAALGGFTAVACMPNTDPPIDDDTQVEFVRRQAARYGHARVYPIGALTKQRAGVELSEMGLMVRAGAVAFSDDGDGVASASVCMRAMTYLSQFDRLFIQHCEEKSLAGGVMNAGTWATRLGLPGIPAVAEEIMAQRDITLARVTGVRYHVAHISTRGTVELVRRAKAEGLPVTTEVCPHHLLLNEEACVQYNPNCKMNPPLRSAGDVKACIEGVRDGTIDCLVTDHAPHMDQEKELGFVDAPFGIIGLETALPLFIQALIEPGVLDWPRLVAAMSSNPARLLRVPGGSLKVGEPADVTVIDPNIEHAIDLSRGRSKSRNSPFDGRKVRGRATHTIVGGRIRLRQGELIGAGVE